MADLAKSIGEAMMRAELDDVQPTVIEGKKHYTIVAESECGCPVRVYLRPSTKQDVDEAVISRKKTLSQFLRKKKMEKKGK